MIALRSINTSDQTRFSGSGPLSHISFVNVDNNFLGNMGETLDLSLYGESTQEEGEFDDGALVASTCSTGESSVRSTSGAKEEVPSSQSCPDV